MSSTLIPFLIPNHNGPTIVRKTAVATALPDALDGNFAALLLQDSAQFQPSPAPSKGHHMQPPYSKPAAIRGEVLSPALPASLVDKPTLPPHPNPSPARGEELLPSRLSTSFLQEGLFPPSHLAREQSAVKEPDRNKEPTALQTTHFPTSVRPRSPVVPVAQPLLAPRAAAKAKPVALSRLPLSPPSVSPVPRSPSGSVQHIDTSLPLPLPTAPTTPSNSSAATATPPQPSSNQPTALTQETPLLSPPESSSPTESSPPSATENPSLVGDTPQPSETHDVTFWAQATTRSAELTLDADGHAVQVKVALSGSNETHITLLTEHATERAALREDREQLRQMLHSEGLHLASMTVGAGAGGSAQRQTPQHDQDSPPPGWQTATVQAEVPAAARHSPNVSDSQGVDVFV